MCPTGPLPYAPQAPENPLNNRNPAMPSPVTSRINFFDFPAVSFAVAETGDNIDTAFPSLTRIGSSTFQEEVGIIGIQFSISIVNPADAVAGLFVCENTGEDISANGARNVYLSQFTHRNSDSGIYTPMARSSSIQYGPYSAVKIESQGGVGLYACAADNSDVALAGVVSIFYVPLR